MINKEDFYLKDIELCKQLEGIMKKKGIEEDHFFVDYYKCPRCGIRYDKKSLENWLENEDRDVFCCDSPGCYGHIAREYISEWACGTPTYRKDSLEAAIKKHWGWISKLAWCNNNKILRDIEKYWDLERLSTDLKEHIVSLYKAIVRTDDIQESLKAIAELIVLLDKELG